MRKSDWDLKRGIENLSTEVTAHIALARVAAIVGYAALLMPAAWGIARLAVILLQLTHDPWGRSVELLLPGFVLAVLLILGSRGWLPGTHQIPHLPFAERTIRNTVMICSSVIFLLFFERPGAGFLIEMPFVGIGMALAAVCWTMRRHLRPSEVAALIVPLIAVSLLAVLTL